MTPAGAGELLPLPLPTCCLLFGLRTFEGFFLLTAASSSFSTNSFVKTQMERSSLGVCVCVKLGTNHNRGVGLRFLGVNMKTATLPWGNLPWGNLPRS